MAAPSRRVGLLALAFLVAACATQVAAPRPTDSPSATATAEPRPSNTSNDLLYVRSLGAGGEAAIVVINARTGATARTMANGPISADGSTLYWSESVNGATQTVVHVTHLVSGREIRSFTVDGYLKPLSFTGSQYELTGKRLSDDAEHLVLTNTPYKNPNDWVTKLAVINTSSGAVVGAAEIVSPSTFGILAISPDGRSVFLDQYGEGMIRTRVFDVPSRTLIDVSGSALSQNGFRTPPVFSADGRWMFRVDSGNADGSAADTPFAVALDLLGRRSVRIALPLAQRSGDFEKYLLWSVALSRDGSTLYAVNPAVGAIDEIDAIKLTLRRTGQVTLSRSDPGPLAGLGRLFVPMAEAKRYLTGGAVLSPDGGTLYAAAHDGIAVIDTRSLVSRAVWEKAHQFDELSLSADGLRLYAVDNMNRDLLIMDAREGSSLGRIKLTSYVPAIVRIDSAR